MYTGSYETDVLLKYITNYYLKERHIESYIDYFDILITNDIIHDYNDINHTQFKNINSYSGLVIPPKSNKDKIIILISENHISPDFLFHELCHMEDMVLFAQKFCDNNLHMISKHKYYQLFIYWTEFHAALVSIPNSILFTESINSTLEKSYITLANDIRNRLYNKFLHDIIDDTSNVRTRDIMWFLGKITVCNLYDNMNSYSIDQIIIERYPFIIDLYNCMKTMLTFDGFVYNFYRLENLVSSIAL